MSSYLQQLETTPADQRWPLARQWLDAEPLAFTRELRDYRPVLMLPEVTLVATDRDCREVLLRPDLFTVRLYRPKQGDYWMAQDDTTQHWREKGVMRAVLDLESLPHMRAWVGQETAHRLTAAGDTLDVVNDVTRAVPIAFVQHWFGFADSDANALKRWSYWNQMDAFWNQPFQAPGFATPDQITAERNAANTEMRGYLSQLIQSRAAALQAGEDGSDMVSRLLLLSGSQAIRFDPKAVVLNVGGLLIGAVETTSHGAVNALAFLMADPERLAAACAAARDDDTAAFDGMVFEALRFAPAFGYFFRTAERDATLARGTDYEIVVPAGTTVLALTHSAMFDPAAVAHPERFDPSRALRDTYTFGLGLHECLGRAIGAVMIPEIVRQTLSIADFRAGEIDRAGGPVPESWPWVRNAEGSAS
ncbi:cytochrome P450 [Rhodovibrio salinarum]|uniref:Cytochrome P450 n=1 Tax=Rhodovibrio salinarum TaxID=1087 RepID=A0A934V2G0_9PROT|nr:cytochrome P450 [Rhodovibrio salinarum]MBK1699280.1 cytochrome P450 [Rhodovibrio salinarum]